MQAFINEFSNAEMVCIPENIFEDSEGVILDWESPKGSRGCGFFKIKEYKIVFQRSYRDKISFLKLHNLPLDNL